MTDQQRTIIIGITGGIGSGKSTLGRIIESHGHYVIDTDEIARDLVRPGSQILERIASEFGREFIRSDGSLDREKMADCVFNDRDNLARLEAIMHPAIIEEFRRLAHESGREYVYVLIPLLFEADLSDSVDRIWLCYAPREIRLERTMKRDKASREEILARMDNQIPDEDKFDDSDVVFDMEGSIENVENQVELVLGFMHGDKTE